jgi:hypothetical protein
MAQSTQYEQFAVRRSAEALIIDVPFPEKIEETDDMFGPACGNYRQPKSVCTEFLDKGKYGTSYLNYLFAKMIGGKESHSKVDVHYLSEAVRTYWVPRTSMGEEGTPGIFIAAAHNAFAGHAGWSISPEGFWYIFISEIAAYVQQNARACAHLFTRLPDEQVELKVDHVESEEAPWAETIASFDHEFKAFLTPQAMNAFLPTFSTSTVESETAVKVAFMNLVRPYFSYKVETICHIPSIRVCGSIQDWVNLGRSIVAVGNMFPEIHAYIKDLLGVIKEIITTVNDPGKANPLFWDRPYKALESYNNFVLTGWLTALFLYRRTGDQLVMRENFDWRSLPAKGDESITTRHLGSQVLTVPFTLVNRAAGTSSKMQFAAGFMGVDLQEEFFLAPRLGYGVVSLYDPFGGW